MTVLPGPPTLYQAILDHPDRGDSDLSTLRVAVTGAADIPVELIRRVDDELPFSTIVTGYGLTEAGTAVATAPGDDVETIATTVGRPRPGFELRIMGHGREVPTGQPGEVVLRGGSVMAGYLDDPEATAEALSADGWLSTGDIGMVDPAGNLNIVGRSKDMFIVGGFNAYPAEIENVLLRHPDIAKAAVIGIPDERLGEVGMAFVVTARGAGTVPDFIAWCRDQMANYKVPAGGRSRRSTPHQRHRKGDERRAARASRPEPDRAAPVSDPTSARSLLASPTSGWSNSASGWPHRRRPPCWPTGAPMSSRSSRRPAIRCGTSSGRSALTATCPTRRSPSTTGANGA